MKRAILPLKLTEYDFKKFSTASNIQNVVIVGAGLMGAGIAQVSAQSGLNVTLVDQSDSILSKSKANIENSLKRVAKKKFPDDSTAQSTAVTSVISRILFDTNPLKAAQNADLIIEAIIENVGIKQKLFTELEKAASNKTLLASNTSSLSLTDISQCLQRKEKFGGLHFFNPVPMMKLLEVVRISETSDQTFASFVEFGKKLGKSTVACKDTPGFIVNRLLVPYMMEALRMAERGDASIRDIDTAMKLGAGYPMGPFELCDYVGLDTIKFITDGWNQKHPENDLFKPNAILDKMVKDGKLGKKSGEGFFKY